MRPALVTLLVGLPLLGLMTCIAKAQPVVLPAPTLVPAPAVATSPAAQATSASSLAVDVIGPRAVLINTPARYQVRLRNTGATATGELEVEARLPDHLTVTGGTPQPTINGPTLKWRVPSAAAGATVDLFFDATARRGAPFAVDVSTRLVVETVLTATVVEPKLRVSLAGVSETTLRDPFEVVATVTNVGTGTVTNGGLTFNLTGGLKLRQAPQVSSQPFTLAPGQSLNVALALESTKVGPQGIKVKAEADGSINDAGEHSVTVRQPILQVEITGPRRRFAGNPAVYQVTFHNAGDAAAEETVVFVELPAGIKMQSAAPSAMFEPTRNMLYWSPGTIKAGETREFEVTALPEKPGEFEVRASVKDSRNNASENYQKTVAEGHVALTLRMTSTSDLVAVAEKARYDLQIANRGTESAKQWSIRVEVSPGLRLDAGASTGWKEKEGAFVFESTAPLAPGGNVNTSLSFLGDKAGNHKVTAVLTSPDLAGEISRSEPIRVYAD